MAKQFSVYVEIGGKVGASLGRAISAAEGKLAAMGRRVSSIHAQTNDVINGVGRGVGAVGKRMQDAGRSLTAGVSTPLGLLGLGAGKMAFEFEKAGNMLEALGDATSEQRKEFEAYANELNKKYPQSLAGIINTGNEMLKGGFDFSQMKGAIDQTLATAVLGEMTPAEVGNMMARTINSFQLPMKTYQDAMRSSQRVSDQMTYAAVKTTASLKDMGEAYRYIGGASSAAGIPLETSTGLIMAMAKNGSVGSDAGVALRSAIVRMVKMPNKGLAAMERIGLKLSDYQGNARKVTAENVIGGLQADGIDANPVKKQIAAALNNKALAGSPVKLSGAITKIIQQGVAGAGKDAIDSKVLAENVQSSIVAAGSQIDLVKFFGDLKKKIETGQAGLGDVATILEGRHASRYQAILQSDLPALIAQVIKESDGYTQARYGTVLKGIVGPVYELSAALEKLSVAFGRAVFSDLAKGITAVADGIESLSESNPAMLRFAALTALGAIALGPFLMAAGATVRVVALLARGLMLLGTAATLGLATRLIAVAKGVTAITMAASLAAVGRLRAMAAGLIALAAVGGSKAVLAALGASLLKFAKAILLFPLTALRGIGAAMLGLAANPVGAVILGIVTALTALGVWVANNWSGLKTFFSSFGESFMKGLGPEAAGSVTAITDALKSVYDWVMKVLGPIDEGGAKWKSWGEGAGQAAASIVNELVSLPSKLTSVAGQFASAMGSLAQQGWDAAKAIDWAGLGSAIIDGIVDGVKGAAKRLASAVASAASDAWSAAKRSLGVGGGDGGGAANASPSNGAPVVAGARARGGPVRSGLPYLVGERGPEIFVPNASGNVETNSTYQKLASLGSSSGSSGMRAPSAESMANSGVSAAPGGSSKTIRGGDVKVEINIQGGNGGANDIARHAEAAVRRVLAQYESDQRGLLSD